MSLISRRKLWSYFEALYSRELNENSIKDPTPEWIRTPLLPHQQAAVHAALAFEKAKMEGMDVSELPGDPVGGKLYSSHGIFGDHVGSGKSLSALALVKAPAPPSSYTEYIVRGGGNLGDGRDVGLLRVRDQLKSSHGVTLKPVQTTLFLVPHALIGQWETYVQRDTTIKALFIKKKLEASAENFMTNIENYDAIFVSSTMWSTLRLVHPIRTILWKRVFIDEADSISISTDNDEINGLFYWFITASWLNLVFSNGAYFNIGTTYPPLPDTPTHVIERVSKLQGGSNILSISGCRHMNLIRRMCGVSSSPTISLNAAGSQSARLILHSSEEFIKKSFTKPTITHTNIICATPANIRVLDSFISTEMLERLNAGDVTGALETIGMEAHTEAEIVSLVTVSLHRELDQARRTYEFKKTIEYSSPGAKEKAIEACEKKISSIESRISSIQERIQRATDQTCPICYCDVISPSVTPCCQQLFCFPCLCESLKRVAACPLCRERIVDIKDIQVVGNPSQDTSKKEDVSDQNVKLNKKEALIKFLKANKNAKVLMFSGYDASFSGLENRLHDEGITFANVNGSLNRINKLLREFKAGKYNVLFLNARNMGAGLNIESATHVVLFHRMSSELEKQIIGRAMRLGRKNPLDVIHLLHENEMGDVISHA